MVQGSQDFFKDILHLLIADLGCFIEIQMSIKMRLRWEFKSLTPKSTLIPHTCQLS